MGRGLSTAAKNYTGPFLWAVKITLRDATVKNYAGDAVTFLGTTYEGLLISASARVSRGFVSDSGEVSLVNSDLTIATLLKTKAFEGSLAELKKLLLGIDEEYTVAEGLVTEEAQNERQATLRIVSRLDPSGIAVPRRTFMEICEWRYKAPECGSASGLTTCDKDHASCVTRAAEHRYSGMPSVSPELVRLVAETPGTAGGIMTADPTRHGGGTDPSAPLRGYPVPL